MVGDGCVRYYPEKRVYTIEITGNADDEKDYFEKISNFLQKKFNKTPRIYIKHLSNGKALKLALNGKAICEYFMDMGITKAKTYTATVPSCIQNWQQAKDFLRGLFEADGSLYFSKSKQIPHPNYPRLEIKTVSPDLARGVYKILSKNGFNVQFRYDGITNRIYLSGEKMLYKWMREIGFSSEKNQTKYLLWKRLVC